MLNISENAYVYIVTFDYFFVFCFFRGGGISVTLANIYFPHSHKPLTYLRCTEYRRSSKKLFKMKD